MPLFQFVEADFCKKHQNMTIDTLNRPCEEVPFQAARELCAQVSGTQLPKFARNIFFLHSSLVFRSIIYWEMLTAESLHFWGLKKKGIIKSCKLIAQLPLLIGLEQKAKNLESPQIFVFSYSVVLSLRETRLG